MKNPLKFLLPIILLIGIFSFVPIKSKPSQNDGYVTINALSSRPFKMILAGNIAQKGDQMGLWPDKIFDPIKAIGINELRVHDAKAFDWDAIFPNMSADPDDPKNYHFENSDRVLKDMSETGFIPFVRLGVGYGASKGRRLNATNPVDKDKWVKIANHIVGHYVDGWGNGHHYTIKNIEVWNEPDVDFWTGDKRSFIVMCGKVLLTLKQNYPNINVGACGIAEIVKNKAFAQSFLSYLSDPNNDGSTSDRIPLDFLSWHVYGSDHSDNSFIESATTARALLNKYGYTNTKSICTEYNADFPSKYLKTDGAAVDVASVLMWGEKNNVDEIFYYPLIADWGLFDLNGNWNDKDNVSLKYTNLTKSFSLYNTLKVNTPEVMAIAKSTLSSDYQILAARTSDSKTVQVLIAYKGNYPSKIKISIKGITPSSNMDCTTKDFTTFTSERNEGKVSFAPYKNITNELDFDYNAAPNSVNLVKIQL